HRIETSGFSQLRRDRKRMQTPPTRHAENALEPLESRRLYAVTAASAAGVLTVTGDQGSNAITISRDAAGHLLVNNGAIAIAGPTATVANTQLIKVLAGGGNDNVILDETNGLLPKASLS